ncbi:MAG: chloride channel protein [Holophagaceae bacterium]
MEALKRRLGWTVWDLAMGAAVGLLCGGASAGFLWALERVIALRVAHPWLLACLPLLGLLSAWLYRAFGRESEGGSGMVLDEVLEFRGRVRTRLAPLVLIGTLLTHLGGGSAGREGTAVQMGASLARTLGKLPWRWLRLTRSRQRLLIMAGVSGGFGSLFGTPVAGAVFGMEVTAPGRLHAEGLLVCAAASFVGDLVARALGARHAAWSVPGLPFQAALVAKAALLALPVAVVAVAFTRLSHGLAAWTSTHLRWWQRPLLGGLVVGALFLAFPQDGYLNLGLPFLEGIFKAGTGTLPWAFALKLLFTAVTVGFGFKGGEVTPLFVIGALLGAALAPAFGWPAAYGAALGLAGLFAAASNTPLASLLLGIELFGAGFAGPLAVLCFLAFILAGHPGIYGRRGRGELDARS